MIIPTYNELENLPLIVGRVRKARPDAHLLVVDDGSPDGTGELADELASAGSHVPSMPSSRPPSLFHCHMGLPSQPPGAVTQSSGLRFG